MLKGRYGSVPTVRDIQWKGKRALVRADFNVPVDSEGEFADDFRIRQTLPTIQYLMKEGARVVLMTHLGKPDGNIVENLRVDRVQERLSHLLGAPVAKARACIGKDIEQQTHSLKEGEVLLLENLRFHREEEANDSAFAEQLARLGDAYVNDAFGTSHRAHASIVRVPKFLPSCIGLLFEKELSALDGILSNPQRPMAAIVGGTKLESKLPLIERLCERADFILLGNLMAKGMEEQHPHLKHVEKIIMPVDGIPTLERALDIGPETVKLFCGNIQGANTVFWSGPLGKTEEEQYSLGSRAIVNCIAQSGAFSVIGGGDSDAFLAAYGLRDAFSHVSTGGGAMLAFMAGESLPGLEAIEQITDIS